MADEIKKPTREEMEESAQLARRKWPASFEGEDDGRLHITAKDSKALNEELWALDAFRTNSFARGWAKVKR